MSQTHRCAPISDSRNRQIAHIDPQHNAVPHQERTMKLASILTAATLCLVAGAASAQGTQVFPYTTGSYLEGDVDADSSVPTFPFGSYPDLLVRDSSTKNRTHLIFTLPKLTSPISAARLKLKGRNFGTGNPVVSAQGTNVFTFPGENLITWNRQPSLVRLLSNTAVSPTLKFYEWNVASWVQQYAATNSSLSFAMTGGPTVLTPVSFISRDATQTLQTESPRLTLTMTTTAAQYYSTHCTTCHGNGRSKNGSIDNGTKPLCFNTTNGEKYTDKSQIRGRIVGMVDVLSRGAGGGIKTSAGVLKGRTTGCNTDRVVGDCAAVITQLTDYLIAVCAGA